VRLADDQVTVRELLGHAGGVDAPARANLYAGAVPSLSSLYGPVLPCSGPRGTARGNAPGDYAALGQLIADATATHYAAAVTHLVLDPLGMTDSSVPATWPHEDPETVTGYELGPDGTFRPDLDELTAILLTGGLWTSATDLVKFGTGWSSLLPADLASQALRPPADPPHIGLGWRLNQADAIAWAADDGPGASASLIVRLSDNHAYVALANRKVTIMGLNLRILRQDS
jgi:CubicO group peptidase (beta-lactamase class C family)